jgi:hypothetical protein
MEERKLSVFEDIFQHLLVTDKYPKDVILLDQCSLFGPHRDSHISSS